MIPIELTIEGLYSYQKRQTIDFTKLTSAGLFGIFGTVGSGKSSILEAITFAIYGRTDKLNLSGDNRNYNMMNLKSNELLIDFIFEAGKDQIKYRSIVKGRRNSKRFDDVKTFERRSFKEIQNDWEPIETEELEGVVGLSFENFKRTIIIPQGQFQEFLQLGNRDRTQMMKELFNLEKYEFYYKVVSLENKNNTLIQNIGGQLQQLGNIDPSQVDAYNTQLKELEESIKVLNIKLESSEKEEERLRLLKENIRKRDEAQKELNRLTEMQHQITNLENRIRRYEQSVVDFKYILKSLDDNRTKANERKMQITKDEAKLKSDSEKIEELVKEVKTLKVRFDKREELSKKANELNTLIRIKQLENDIKREADGVETGNKYWADTNVIVTALKGEKEELEQRLAQLRATMPDFSLLTTIKSWYTTRETLDGQLTDIKSQINSCIDKEKELLSQKDNLLNGQLFTEQTLNDLFLNDLFSKDLFPNDLFPDDLFSNNISNLNFEESFQLLEKELQKIKEQLSELSNHENHILVKAQLEVYANSLEPDSPCPLCGSLHHPELFKSDDLKEFQEQIKKSKSLLENKNESLLNIKTELSVLQNSYNENYKRLGEFKALYEGQQIKVDNHAKLFVWDRYLTLEDLNIAFDNMVLIQNNIKDCETELTKKADELKSKEKILERAASRLDELKGLVLINSAKLQTLQEQLQIISPLHYTNIDEDTIISERDSLLSEYSKIDKEYNQKVELLNSKNQQRDLLIGGIENNRTVLDGELQTIQNLEKEVDLTLSKSEFSSIEEVKSILSETIDIIAEKQRIENYRDGLLKCKSTLEQLDKEIGDNSYDSEIYVQLVKDINDIKAKVSQMTESRGQINELYNRLLEKIETQISLHKELEALETRAENIKTMKSLFKASGFVNFISSVHLQNLCNSANSRFFQLTRQKLRLEISEDNNFKVRDFMNGGKERSVKTLSGGQTFQAALSLALALADNIQKITESKQNFFFLDEGFGSLDKESLNIVFDTLKTLRKENRIVGVISHVEEMQQEIETHLHIENHDENGSIIHKSW